MAKIIPGGGAGGCPSLGDRLLAWLRDVWAYAVQHEPLAATVKLLLALDAAFDHKQKDAAQFILNSMASSNDANSNILAAIISALTGKPLPKSKTDQAAEMRMMITDPAGYFAFKVKQVSTSAAVTDASKVFADLVKTHLLDHLKPNPANPALEPFEIAGSLIAGAAIIKAAAGAIGTSAEVLGLGQIHSVSQELIDLTNLLSPTAIIERVIDPALSVGLMPSIERAYSALYHPARIPARDLAVLEGFGVVDAADYALEGGEEGWRDIDLTRIQALVRTRISPDDAQTARDLGLIDDGELFARLKLWRYSDEDARWQMNLAAKSRHIAWNERMLMILLREFLTYRLDEHKLGTVLRAMEFPEERVLVEVAAAKAAMDEQIQLLSVGEVEQAFKANQLSDVEVGNYLTKLHVDASGIPILLRTWKAGMTRGGTHLNAGVLTRAYHDGLIDESALNAKLQQLGWNPSDARLMVKVAGYQKPAKTKTLTESLVTSAFTRGTLTHDEALAKLEELGLTADAAALVLRVHTLLPRHAVKTLSPAEVAKAVELGAIAENEALNRFEAMGYSSEDAALLFVVLTSKVPKPIKTVPPAPGG